MDLPDSEEPRTATDAADNTSQFQNRRGDGGFASG
jgi:hypothetical protein